MKSALSLLAILCFLATSFAKTDPIKKLSESEEAISLANQLSDVLEHLRLNNQTKYKKAMSALSFENTKDMSRKVSQACLIDSLVHENNKLSRWAFYKSVDLDYLMTIEATIVLKHDQSDLIFEALQSQMREKYEVGSEQDGQVVFKDSKGANVVDERFTVTSDTFFDSLYEYQLQIDGEYVILNLHQIIPNKTGQVKKEQGLTIH